MSYFERQKNIPLSREIELLDEKIATLLGERTRLMSKAAGTRKKKKVAIIDATQEKNLWNIWDHAFETESLDKSVLKKLFLLVNSLAYAQVEKKSKSSAPFCMYPRRQPLQIDIQGPRDSVQTRIAITLATKCSAAFRMRHFQTSDSNIELIKAFNQGGASLSWDRSTFKSDADTTLDLNDSVIFCGSDPLNFYLILCRTLTAPGLVKFTGTSATKFLDFRPIQKILPLLGARLTSIDPHSNGLPARVEASGHIPEAIEIPADIDRSFILALAVNAPFFPKGLRIILENPAHATKIYQTIKPVFKQFSIPVSLNGTTLTIKPQLPLCKHADVQIPLDLPLGAYLLTLPFFRGGQARLQGTWPEEARKGSVFESIISEFGISLEVSDQSVATFCEERPDAVFVDITGKGKLLPLVTALCLGVRQNATIRCDESTPGIEQADEFLTYLNVDHTIKNDRIDIRPKNSTMAPQEGAWESPSPYWTLSYVMASFVIPGICLANPGELTAAWPDFWNTFNNLPAPQDAIRSAPKKETKATHEQPKNKRIRVTNR